jgi:hypothetical protein
MEIHQPARDVGALNCWRVASFFSTRLTGASRLFSSVISSLAVMRLIQVAFLP